MNSIDEQQEEKNHQDLMGKEAGKKIKELAEKNSTCFFLTDITSGDPTSVRPMSATKIDEEGNFYFLSANDSQKNADIEKDSKVQLLFQGSNSDFLSVYGEAIILTDRALIEELWEPIVKTWFTGGVNDPRITVLKVTTIEAYYWDNKHGDAIALIKMAAGALLGKTMDDSIEGSLTP